MLDSQQLASSTHEFDVVVVVSMCIVVKTLNCVYSSILMLIVILILLLIERLCKRTMLSSLPRCKP